MVDKEKEIIQWDNWLLEAVRKIRTQKQRPGLDRIYNAVRLLAEKHELAEHSQKSPIAPIYHVQFNQIKIEQVQRHLDRAVRKGLLLKVFSKGQATYKAVEKSERTLNLAKEHGADNSNNGNGGELSKCILKVIRELSECDAPVPTSSSVTVSSLNKPPKLGYTFNTIEEYIRHSHVIIYPDDSLPDFFPSLVRQALAKECSRGKLELVSGEYYRLPPEKHGAASQGSTSSGGSKTKTSTLTNPTTTSASCISSSSNSNSSWSSTASSNTAATAAAANPITFSGISPSVTKVKSATTSSSTSSVAAMSATASLGTSLIKKDSNSGAVSVSGSSGKTKGKDVSPPVSTTTTPSSPPRGNLAGDLLTEAEEIALVTEQTARAVMLVMKDRRPGEKPAQKKSSPPPPEVVAHQPTVPSKSPHTAQQDETESEKRQAGSSGSGASSSDENSFGNGGSRRDSLTGGESLGNNGGNGNGGSGGNGQNGKNGTNGNKGSAVIKLMVPSFPGRNNGNGNGNNGKNGNGNGNGGNGASSTNPSGTSSGSSKPPSPSQGEGLASQQTSTTPSASQSEFDKKCKTVSGNLSGTPSVEVVVAQSNNDKSPVASSEVGPSTMALATAQQQLVSCPASAVKAGSSSSSALSISSIASAIMNKSFGKRSMQIKSGEKTKSTEWTTKGFCVICGNEADSKIIRDSAYMKIVQQYFSVIIGIDVKPALCSNTDLCSECFNQLVDLNETLEILLYFENYAKGIRLELLTSTLDMVTANENGRKTRSGSMVKFGPLGWINQEIKNIHLDNKERLTAEEESVKLILSGYQTEFSKKK